MSFTKTARISQSGTTKTATCDITASVVDGAVVPADSSISCSIPWPKSKALSKSSSILVVAGDVNSGLRNVKVEFDLSKAKNKGSGTTKTKNAAFSSQDFSSDTPATYPADLWCPQEDTIVYTDAGTFVNEVMENCHSLSIWSSSLSHE